MQAYTRVDDNMAPDAVTQPDVVVVTSPRWSELDVRTAAGGTVILNAATAPPDLKHVHVVCVPATGNVNVTLAGAAAALAGTPAQNVADAAVRLLGKKVPVQELRDAVEEGYACLT
jgi:Pyruvate/2-oxoacid:ferredoxin oxidoreductase gamma subunit